MRPGARRHLLKVCIYLLIAFGCFRLYVSQSPEFFTPVPADRHSAIVGDWYVDRFGSFRHYIFRADGTGEIWTPNRETRKFTWGTQGQVLRMKYRTQNGWTVPEFKYSTDPESDQLTLEAVTTGYSMVMKREAPPSATLQ